MKFPFSASRPALGPIQPPIQWVSRAISPGVKHPGYEDDLHLVMRLRMCGAVYLHGKTLS